MYKYFMKEWHTLPVQENILNISYIITKKYSTNSFKILKYY